MDPDLLAVWSRGWALTRGAAAPVEDNGGWRIEVGQADHLRRFVFARADTSVTARAAQVDEPFVFLKICDPEAEVRALLDSRWRVQRTGHVMRLDRPMATRARHPGYDAALTVEDGVTHVRLRTDSGTEAARGRAVKIEDAVIFDRIAVEAEHRRRGLGGAVMRALQEAVAGPDLTLGLLVATDEGRALYETLGWRALSDYVTAQLPAD
jgi:GNAT superfamily N-acetyltransferase